MCASRVVHGLWRESATLMIVGRNAAKCDYKLLFLQRNSQSRFMPGTYVFPGGVIDNADFADEWMDLYRNYKGLARDFKSLVDIKGPRPPIFQKSSTSIPCEVAFRICAIRETFEESGLLLLKKLSEIESKYQHGSAKGCVHVSDKLSNLEIQKWRQDVHHDPSKFFTLCKYLDSVPDVWSLTEWANWLTPTDLKIRFDTAFFICFSDHEPPALHDEGETVHSVWKTPAEALIDNFSKRSRLGFPQLYTMLQLLRMQKWDELKAFQESRAKEGCSRTLTIRITCSDGSIAVFPGDEMYPKVLDYVLKSSNGNYGIKDGFIPNETFTSTCEELEAGMKQFHRIILKTDGSRIFKINCSLGHGLPVPLTEISQLLKDASSTKSKM